MLSTVLRLVGTLLGGLKDLLSGGDTPMTDVSVRSSSLKEALVEFSPPVSAISGPGSLCRTRSYDGRLTADGGCLAYAESGSGEKLRTSDQWVLLELTLSWLRCRLYVFSNPRYMI